MSEGKGGEGGKEDKAEVNCEGQRLDLDNEHIIQYTGVMYYIIVRLKHIPVTISEILLFLSSTEGIFSLLFREGEETEEGREIHPWERETLIGCLLPVLGPGILGAWSGIKPVT